MAGALVTTNILQTLVAMGLNALREQIVLTKLVNRNYEGLIVGSSRGSTVNVSVPAAVATRTVAPDVVPPAVTAVTPTSVAVTLSEWEEAPFAIDDKGLAQVAAGIIPMQASEAIKALANGIDNFLWGKYKKFYGYAGVAGTVPFATDLSEYLDARKAANDQLMPRDPRYMLIDTDAEANALGLRAFQDASFGGGADVIVNGQIGRKLGALWAMTQNVPTHTAGTWNDTGTTTGTNAAGQATVNLTGGTGSLLVGDIITFSGADTQTYVVLTATGTAPTTAITVSPNLVTAKSSTETVTNKATHKVNLLIHRDAIAFAMAPLNDAAGISGVLAPVTAVDEESGLSLRLEVTRQHKQLQWSFDALYGASVIRPELGVRLAG
jgi:hypothetical protein